MAAVAAARRIATLPATHRDEEKTMNKTLTGSVLSAALLAALVLPAGAADLRPRPVTKAPPPVPTPMAQVYNWTGFYIGGHIGGAFAGDNSLAGSDGRFLGGVQLGADYQFNSNWVLGIEAQYGWLTNGNGGVAFPVGGIASQEPRGIGSVTGRFGYAWGPTLAYVKGGYAFADNHTSVTVAGVPQAFTADGGKDGWTVGAGLEYMFAPNWSAKVEYQYYDFGNTTFSAGPPALVGTSFRNDVHTVKAGLNYRFNWGGPEVPRY